MFNYNLLINLFLKKGIKKYVRNNGINIGDVIVCLSCLNNFYVYGKVVRKAIDMLFILKPLHTYIYLYYNIPKCNKMPYAKKIRKFKYELPPEYEELGKVFGWSKTETFKNRLLLDTLYTKEELKRELGIK